MINSSVYLLLLFLIGGAFSQCFTDSECTGGTVAAASERECCIQTDSGGAFLSDGMCTACASELVHVIFSYRVYTCTLF